MKKGKFPKKLFVYRTIDIADDEILLCTDAVKNISEDSGVEVVGIYQLVGTGTFNIEKTVVEEVVKKKKFDLDNATHQEMVSYVQEIGLKLHTKNLDTKKLRNILREYQRQS